MAQEQQQGQEQQQDQQQSPQRDRQQPQDGDAQASQATAGHHPFDDVDGLADKKPEELTPDELRLMADTMPGEGPGD